MTDIVPYDPTSLAAAITTLADLATRVADTQLIPKGLRGHPDAVLAAMLRGREIGLDPFQSLTAIHLIEGVPTLSPESMRAVVLAHGHRIVVKQRSDESVTVWGRRRDNGDEDSVTWTMDDAARAGLDHKQTWKQYPRSMLEARATAALCRSLFPDVVRGLSYVPEEIASIDVDSWEDDDAGRPFAPELPGQEPSLSPELPDEDRAGPAETRITARLEGLSPGERERLAAAWKRDRIPPLHSPAFSESHAETVERLILELRAAGVEEEGGDPKGDG